MKYFSPDKNVGPIRWWIELLFWTLSFYPPSLSGICYQSSHYGDVLAGCGDGDLILHASPAQCAVSASLSGGEYSKLNINRTRAVTLLLRLHQRAAIGDVCKYRPTKGYHHLAQKCCWDTHNLSMSHWWRLPRLWKRYLTADTFKVDKAVNCWRSGLEAWCSLELYYVFPLQDKMTLKKNQIRSNQIESFFINSKRGITLFQCKSW